MSSKHTPVSREYWIVFAAYRHLENGDVPQWDFGDVFESREAAEAAIEKLKSEYNAIDAWKADRPEGGRVLCILTEWRANDQ